jgi:hypothetical protein
VHDIRSIHPKSGDKLTQWVEDGLFLELQQESDATGDYYRINSAFPVSDSYVSSKEKKEGWKTLWSRHPVSASASGAPGFAGKSPNAGGITPMVSPQSDGSNIRQLAAESKVGDPAESPKEKDSPADPKQSAIDAVKASPDLSAGEKISTITGLKSGAITPEDVHDVVGKPEAKEPAKAIEQPASEPAQATDTSPERVGESGEGGQVEAKPNAEAKDAAQDNPPKFSQSSTPANNPYTLSTLATAIDKAMGRGFTKLLEATGMFKLIESSQIGKYLDENKVKRDFLNGTPIIELTGDEFKKDDVSLIEKVTAWFDSQYQGKVSNEVIGEVLLNENGVKSSIAHGLGRNKSIAFAAVPSIIKDGMIIDHEKNWKGRGYDGYTIAAPIAIAGKEYVGVVIVHKDVNSGRFYLQEVILRESLQREPFKTEALTTDDSALNGGHAGAIAKLLQSIYSVNSDTKFSKSSQTDTPLLAPNGKRSNLTSTQYAQVRTAKFKAWFGDWEKAHNGKDGHGVWQSNYEGSKVVDENGEPLVVYHGTEKGGFTVFKPTKADKHSSPMVFTAKSRGTAASYARTSGDIEIAEEPSTQKDFENLGFDFNEQTDESGDENNLFELRLNGYSYGENLSLKEAIDIATEDYQNNRSDFADNETNAGLYPLFLNIRNPSEASFEGANWDGSRGSGEYIIWDNETEEPVYTPDGRSIMDEDEANDRAATLQDEYRYEIRSAPDQYESTNTVAEDAKRYGNDGAIIRDTVDDGGRGGNAQIDDVFVFFNSNQAKSATLNNGDFSQYSDDIRYSKDGRILAFVKDGVTHLVYDNISSTDDNVKGLLLHEVGLHALTLGRNEPEFQAILKQFKMMGKMGNAQVRTAKEQAAAEKVDKAEGRVPKDTEKHLLDEEHLGHYLEQNPNSSFTQKVIAWFRAQVRKLGAMLKGSGKLQFFQWANKLTPEDIVYMATQALRSAPTTLQNAQDRGAFKAEDAKVTNEGMPLFSKRQQSTQSVEFDGTEFGGKSQPIGTLVLKAREFARRMFAEKTVTATDGHEILIPWSGIKHTFSGKVSANAAIIASKLDKVIENGVLIKSEADKEGRNTIKAVHTYETPVMIAGEPVTIHVIVREALDGRRFYDHYEADVEAAGGISGERIGTDSIQPTPATLPNVSGRDNVLQNKEVVNNSKNNSKNILRTATPSAQNAQSAKKGYDLYQALNTPSADSDTATHHGV